MRTFLCVLALAGACHKAADPKPAAAAPDAHHEDRDDPATAAPVLTVGVTIAGTASTWGPDAFAKVPKLTGKATSGEARDVWSLRALAEANVGPGARVVSVTGPDGTVTIAPAAWADATRTPILHTTRRGTLKFRWAGPDGAWEEALVRDVSTIELAR